MPRITNRIRVLAAGVMASSSLLVAATPAAAGTADEAPGCPPVVLETPFTYWNDYAKYVRLADGGFESDGAGWKLTGGAAAADGNEPFYVRAPEDKRSLLLPPGSSATSPEICIGLEYPTLRFFARTTAPAEARLAVHVLFRKPDGSPAQLKIAELAASDTWQPTRTIFILANLLALHPSWDGRVAFRFTPVGGAGNWSIDDVYVDPYER
jgi:hypothetical protein